MVAGIIVWVNDHMTIEVPVITAILLVMLSMAFHHRMLIGVHTALGAFVAGILVGQSPILTEQIEVQLRGFIFAFFSPVFFAVAGLGMDLRTLMDTTLLLFTVAVILVASVGKFAGALVGGRIGGLTLRESLALAIGLNARGSTEVIVASIGLAMGALSRELYTMIVAMAVVTTMVMPPTLRWMMARVPLGEDELKRLDKEDAEHLENLPNMERALVYVDDSANGRLAGRMGGLFAASRQLADHGCCILPARKRAPAGVTAAGGHVAEAASCLAQQGTDREGSGAAPPQPAVRTPHQLVQAKPAGADDAIEREIAKGYDIAFVGVDHPIEEVTYRFEDRLQRLIEAFTGPVAIASNGAGAAGPADVPLDILVPTSGSADARLATEIALALAKASGGTVTALHVFDPHEDTALLRGRARRLGMSVLVDAHRLVRKRSDVPVKGLTATNIKLLRDRDPPGAAHGGRFDLLVLGTSLRQGEAKFLGPRTAMLLRGIRTPVLLVAR